MWKVYDGLIGLNKTTYNSHVSERTDCLVVNSPLLGCQGPVLFSRSFSCGLSFRSPFRTLPIETLQIIHLWGRHSSARSGKSGLWKHPNAVLNTFFLFLQSFLLFRNYLWLSLKWAGSFIWKLYPLSSRMLCAKFGWNWPSVQSWEDENVKSWQTDGRTTDSRRKETNVLTWAHSFKSDI